MMGIKAIIFKRPTSWAEHRSDFND